MSSTTCPSNSTECLLRAILEAASPGYNWNPLNFAFTAALSILAFAVAVFGLFQALVAAGPGRLKASTGALGPVYHGKAKTRWDRTEFRFRTTAFVPVIDIQTILSHCQPSVRPGSSQVGHEQAPRADPVAGWALLLHELNLTHIPFDTTYVLTDYLPGDILAAPALASVESLVILALMRGCNTIRPDTDDFLTAIGPSMQLDFQIHPTMGSIGTYRHFSHSMPKLRLDQVHIRGLINEARGSITFNNEDIYIPLFRPGTSMESQLIYDPFARVFNKAISACNHHHYYCTGLRKAFPEPNCQALFSRDMYNNRDIYMFTALLIGDAPIAAKAFPTKGTQLNRLLNGIKNTLFPHIWEAPLQYELEQLQNGASVILLNERERARRSTGHEYFAFEKHEYRSWATFAEVQDQKQCYPRIKFLHTGGLAQDTATNKNPNITLKVVNEQLGRLRVSTEAALSALGWLSDKEYFARQNDEAVEFSRKWLRFQIAEVDWFLATKGGFDAFCACANLIYHTPYVLTTEDGDPTTEARPTYIRCKAKYLLPETLNAFNLPWEWDSQDPSFVVIKQYIDNDFQNQLFEHTANIILNRRNATTTWKSNWSFHTESIQGRSEKTVSSDNEIFPGEATDVSVGNLSGRHQRRRRSASVASWNKNTTARPETPPTPSTPSSHWSAPSYGPYDGRPRRMYGEGRRIIIEGDANSQLSGSLPRDQSTIEEHREQTGEAAERASSNLSAHSSERSKQSVLAKSPASEANPADTVDATSPKTNRSFEVSHKRDTVVLGHASEAPHGLADLNEPALTRFALHKLNFDSHRVGNEQRHAPQKQSEDPDKREIDNGSHTAQSSRRQMSSSIASQDGQRPVDAGNLDKASISSSASTKGDVREAPDPRMKAMETLLFFRALLVATLLASGADSTLLLKSEKRQQVVQVL